jgi:hypothetical protein
MREQRARSAQAGDKSRSKQRLKLLAAFAALHPNLSLSLFHVHSTANRPWCGGVFCEHESIFSRIALRLQRECTVCFFVLEKVLLCFYTSLGQLKSTRLLKCLTRFKNSNECSSFISSQVAIWKFQSALGGG